MSLTVKTGDVTKGRKDVDPHGRFKDEWVKKLVLEILLAAFLKKRMATLVTTEKRLQVLKIFKGNTNVYFFFFSVVLTVDKSFCVSDLVLEVNFVQRLRGKEE